MKFSLFDKRTKENCAPNRTLLSYSFGLTEQNISYGFVDVYDASSTFDSGLNNVAFQTVGKTVAVNSLIVGDNVIQQNLTEQELEAQEQVHELSARVHHKLHQLPA